MAKMFIAGESAGSSSGQSYEVVNPANGEIVDSAPKGVEADMRAAIDAAVSALSMSASSHTIIGSLPPNSNVTRFIPALATSATCLPVPVSPVNAMRRTFGLRSNSSPTTLPGPVTTFKTPFGRPA